MSLLPDLNRDQGSTFTVVVHNLTIACAAGRVVTVHDGYIKRDELIGNVYLEDLCEFEESLLRGAI